MPLWWPGCKRRIVNVGRNHFQGCHHHFIHSFVVIITITSELSVICGTVDVFGGTEGTEVQERKVSRW